MNYPMNEECPFYQKEKVLFKKYQELQIKLISERFSESNEIAADIARAAYLKAQKERYAEWEKHGYVSPNEKLLKAIFGEKKNEY